jgi:hypothetical protein
LAGSVDTSKYAFVETAAAPAAALSLRCAAARPRQPKIAPSCYPTLSLLARTSLLLHRDAVLPRQLDHLHAERVAQHALRLGEDGAELPRARGAKHARHHVGAPDWRPRELAAQRVAHEPARQLRRQPAGIPASAAAAAVVFCFFVVH